MEGNQEDLADEPSLKDLNDFERNYLTKYLKNKTEFRGWGKTAQVIMKDKELTKIKAKALTTHLLHIFMLSEDYDSDSDSSDSEDSDIEKKPT